MITQGRGNAKGQFIRDPNINCQKIKRTFSQSSTKFNNTKTF